MPVLKGRLLGDFKKPLDEGDKEPVYLDSSGNEVQIGDKLTLTSEGSKNINTAVVVDLIPAKDHSDKKYDSKGYGIKVELPTGLKTVIYQNSIESDPNRLILNSAIERKTNPEASSPSSRLRGTMLEGTNFRSSPEPE